MRSFRAILVSLMISLTAPAFAHEAVAFDPDRFAQAQNERRPILVEITASWCSTCAAQKPILEHLSASPEFKALSVFVVDIDTQKDVVRRFHAQMQSTLIVFKGKNETARSVGDTSEPSIEQLLRTIAG